MAQMAHIPIAYLYRVAVADPSGGKTHKDSTQSRSAVVVLGQDELEREYLLHVFAEQCPTSQFIEEIVRVARMWRPRAFGVDVTGPQGPFYDSLVLETRRRGMRVPFVPVTFKGEKITRIEDTLEPSLSDGRLFVHPSMERAHEEGREFPTGFLDTLDCMAAAKRMLPKRATTKTKIAEREREVEVLRQAGMPFGTIMERIAQKFGR
jgi:hypothetical protein